MISLDLCIFYWSIADLQCCVSFWRRAKWLSYAFIYIFIEIPIGPQHWLCNNKLNCYKHLYACNNFCLLCLIGISKFIGTFHISAFLSCSLVLRLNYLAWNAKSAGKSNTHRTTRRMIFRTVSPWSAIYIKLLCFG